MNFQISITEPSHLAGITAARDAHNADLPDGAMPLATDADYVQFVMVKAAESYSKQYHTDAP